MSVYVSMKDTFMSGWGKAKGKKNILIFECKSMAEAMVVSDNAMNRSDQEGVSVSVQYPHFPFENYYVQHKDKTDYPSWYVEGYFKRKKV